MRVRELDLGREQEVQRWNDFVRASGRLYRHTHWAEILLRTYGFTPRYLFVEDRGEIVSVFPLFHVRLPGLKNELVSIPHVESGGILNTEWYQLYLDYIAEKMRIDSLVVRQYEQRFDDLPANMDEVVMVKKLPSDERLIVAGIPAAARRRCTRKALEGGFSSVSGNSEEMLRIFYSLYCRKMREFGTPPQPIAFIRNMASVFKEDCVVTLAEKGGESLGGVISIIFGDAIFGIYFAVPHDALQHHVGDFLVYQVMAMAVRRNLIRLVMGRTARDSGVYKYKREVGAEAVPLYLYNFELTPEGYKVRESRTAKERHPLAPRIWRKLPSIVTGTIGPHIRKWVY